MSDARSAIGRRLSIKLLVLVLIAGALAVPLLLISSLVEERQERLRQVTGDVAAQWGPPALVRGPMLLVPAPRGETVSLLPTKLTVTSVVTPAERYRGLFRVPTFVTSLRLAGSFRLDPAEGGIDPGALDWQHARLATWLPGRRLGPTSASISWAGAPARARFGDIGADVGLSAVVDATAVGGTEVPFVIELELPGSEWLQLAPTAQEAEVAMRSPWPSPSFVGDLLPTERQVDEHGFTATWRLRAAAATLPVASRTAPEELVARAPSLGVRLFQPSDDYQVTARAVKYALLIIAITFAVFFAFELLAGVLVHPVQYLLVGAALTLFYLLLLSLAEHLGFTLAYVIAALAVVAQLTAYARSITRSGRRALGFGGLLVATYGVMYLILRAEDLALLAGSVALFALLGLIMWATRNVDWYGQRDEASPPAP